MIMRCIRTLTAAELPKYRDHLLRLDAEDRRLRFGFIIDDEGICEHVRQLDPQTNRIIVQIDDDLRVVGAAHIAPADGGAVEFAVSVDRAWRGRGVGTQLFDQAVLRARNRGMRRAYVYSLVDNQVMRHLARKAGMEIHSEAGESEACLALPPPTTLSLLREVASERWGMYDYSVKASRRNWRPLRPLPAI
jgi:RimJ/RimL family protein N-acetyltransferase